MEIHKHMVKCLDKDGKTFNRGRIVLKQTAVKKKEGGVINFGP